MNFFKFFKTAYANWFQAHAKKATQRKVSRSAHREYLHHPMQTDYIPAPRNGWHYEHGNLVRNTIVALVLLALPGCASQQIDHALTNLSKDCQRDYQGAIGALGQGTFSFNIHCAPEGTTTTTTVTVVPNGTPPAPPPTIIPPPSGGQ